MNEEYKKKIEKLNQELLIMKTLNIKPNYSELSKIYDLDRRTIKKYNNGYSKSEVKRNRKSKLDKYYDEIKEKLELPGITINGLYQYFMKKENIGTYSNFYNYVKIKNLKPKKNNKVHLRFET